MDSGGGMTCPGSGSSAVACSKETGNVRCFRIVAGNVAYRVTGYYPVVGHPATPGPTS